MSFIIRNLTEFDYDNGYLDILNQLSPININLIKKDDFNEYIKNLPNNINIFIIIDEKNNKIVGSGTLLIEHKIIHNLGKVGHIEDVVIDKNYRGLGLGKIIINKLIEEAKINKCYKIILVSNNDNTIFYNKLGFTKKDNSMMIYF